ncbi:MAG: efflux RND transporter periplasmic adaptor subunit [Sandaracinus sp.]|nr:efflux RND transporter periplasmic adaptor subunit [Sandaracinus sp.]MCB9613792.1 efflux RND transporter periplasmic adaptor subunit [Sandaracinus sp.]MCB9619878.1 efflux RND transporter periplasmic adaptor subunit [Sandaracinus sp.]
MNRFQISLAAVVGLGAAFVSSGCGHQEAHAEEPEPRFEATSVVRQDTEVVREYVAQIRASQHIEVRALERGYLQDILVDEGQHVARGTRLFQITPVFFRAEVDLASAERRAAEIEYQNTRMLREGNVVSQNELALAEAGLARRAAQQQLAQAHLRFASLDAPFDGIVGRLMVRKGSLVEEGEVLTVLSDNAEMWVYFNVSESEYLTYRMEHELGEQVPVQLRMANGAIFDQPGVIQTIEADFNNETGSIAFRAGFPNPTGLLRHGETGEVRMTTPLTNVLVIPQAATFTVLDRTFVFVVDDEGEVRSREITVGEELPHRYVVREGLREGEHVLVEGLRRVRDGDHVEVEMADQAAVLERLEHLHAE